MTLQLQQKNAEGPEVSRPNLTGIPTQMKLDFERRSGLPFDDVRVHYNSDKPAQLRALAYTQGTQVYIGPGQERHLPHELGHVIQQKSQTLTPDTVQNGVPINRSQTLERLADRYAAGWKEDHSPLDKPVYNQIPVAQRCPSEEEEDDPDWEEEEDCDEEYSSEEEEVYDELDPDNLEDFYSDDESEDNGDVYSYEQKQGRNEEGVHGSNDPENQTDNANKKSDDDLTNDAVAIHNVLEGRAKSGCTVVCARFVTNKGKYIHYAMVNHNLIPSALRDEARTRGYLLIRGINTHAEANMILYALKHRWDLILEAFGCDKPSCPQCAALIREVHLFQLSFRVRSPQTYSARYRFQRRGGQSLRGKNERDLFQCILENYDEDGTKK